MITLRLSRTSTGREVYDMLHVTARPSPSLESDTAQVAARYLHSGGAQSCSQHAPNSSRSPLAYANMHFPSEPSSTDTVQGQGGRGTGLALLYWHTRTWFSELLLLVTASPWHIPLRKDLLSLFRCPNSIQFQLVSSRFDLILHSILNFIITFSECRHHHAG